MQDEGERLGYVKESIVVTREAPVYLLIQVRDYLPCVPPLSRNAHS